MTLAGAMTSSVGQGISRTGSIRSCLNRGESVGTTTSGIAWDGVATDAAGPRPSSAFSAASPERLQPVDAASVKSTAIVTVSKRINVVSPSDAPPSLLTEF